MSSNTPLESLPIIADNVCVAYQDLCRQVHEVVSRQVGDSRLILQQRRACEDFRPHVEHAYTSQAINQATYHTMCTSVTDMITNLDEALSLSADPASTSAGSYERQYIRTGRPGRPALHIPQEQLTILAQDRTTNPEIALRFNCDARTIRRRRIEYGISMPGPAVSERSTLVDGTPIITYYPGRSSDLSALTDTELDQHILQAYHQFPSFGRRMIDGYLMSLGERVPRQRILDAYARVLGPSTRTFAPRRITRQIYSVPGPNSLWHHDGQHGLIRWKIVFHGFVDGFSRLVVGIRASNNNRAATVLDLFHDIVAEYGYPSRLRGDHGTENLYVAREIELVQGEGRGSYIFGRSVHNIRIERLWLDVTKGFGRKWKDLFRRLEVAGQFNAELDAHIWLLHFVFLEDINTDAARWAVAWNHHVISSRTEPHRSPIQKYTHGMVTQGVRGRLAPVLSEDPVSLTDDELAGYGVDWQDLDTTTFRQHHADHNAREEDENPLQANHPHRLAHVNVPDVRCPFSAEEIEALDIYLEGLPHRHATDDASRVDVWGKALSRAHVILGTIY